MAMTTSSSREKPRGSERRLSDVVGEGDPSEVAVCGNPRGPAEVKSRVRSGGLPPTEGVPCPPSSYERRRRVKCCDGRSSACQHLGQLGASLGLGSEPRLRSPLARRPPADSPSVPTLLDPSATHRPSPALIAFLILPFMGPSWAAINSTIRRWNLLGPSPLSACAPFYAAIVGTAQGLRPRTISLDAAERRR